MSARKKKAAARRKVASSPSSGRRKKAAAKKKKAARSKASGALRPGKAARRKSSSRRKKASGLASGSGTTTRVVFYFGDGQADGHADMKDALGGKGANLAEMTNLGVPVPPGFTISTAVCSEYNARGRRLSKSVRADVLTALARVEQSRGRRFGDPERPLLVSVRSGARVSMPGMMDTVLNLGLNHETVEGLAALADERFAFDSYRRFIQMYGDVVLGVPHERFEHLLETRKLRLGVDLDTELEGNDLRGLVREYLEIVEEHTGRPFPQDPEQQLWGAISAVFDSWQNDRAVAYRSLHGIDEAWGTAVNVQSMVFGNMGDDCATGVAFTRNPSTGEGVFYGEYLMNAQGEDVVAGIRTPQPINEASRTADTEGLATLERTSDALERADGVQRIESLATSVRLRAIEDDVEISGFFDEPVTTAAQAHALRTRGPHPPSNAPRLRVARPVWRLSGGSSVWRSAPSLRIRGRYQGRARRASRRARRPHRPASGRTPGPRFRPARTEHAAR